ncbi:MAG: hypothetical protein HZA52_17350 [Planctomycetes bacterium]|nr:hypothetical protein [Planctomycetota bacterium]
MPLQDEAAKPSATSPAAAPSNGTAQGQASTDVVESPTPSAAAKELRMASAPPAPHRVSEPAPHGRVVAFVPAKPDALARVLDWTGVLCACTGVALIVGANVPGANAEFLAHFGNPYSLGGALALGGSLLFGLGRVRRTLLSVHHAVAHVRAETARIDDLARDGQELRRGVGTVAGSTAGLQGELVAIHSRLEELTRLAANPEIQTSIFHLAASQDQLAKRVDVALTERVRALAQELGGAFESVARDQRELRASVDELGERSESRLAAHHTRLQGVLDALAASAEDQSTRVASALESLNDVEHELASQRVAIGNGLAAATEARERVARDAAAGLELVREHVDGRFVAQGRAIDAQLGALERGVGERLGTLERGFGEQLARVASEQERSARELVESVRAESVRQTEAFERGLAELRGKVESEFARLDARLTEEFTERLGELGERVITDHEHEQSLLREGLNALGENAERVHRELGAAIASVAPCIEARLAEEAGALRAAREAEARANVSARKELQSELAELGRNVSEELARLDERQNAAFSQLDERLTAERRAEQTQLRESLAELGATTERVQRELAASVERLAPSLEARLRDEASALHDEVREAARGASEALRELHAGLEALRTRVDQGVERLDGAQTTSLANLVQRMEIDRAYAEAELERGFNACTEASHRTSREFSAGLAQLAPALETALDTALEARVAVLHGGVQQAVQAAEEGANRLRARLEELGERVDQGLGRIDGTQAAVLSELTGRLAADRMHGDLALRGGL